MSIRSRSLSLIAAVVLAVATVGLREAYAQSSEPGPDHTVTLAVNGNTVDISPVTLTVDAGETVIFRSSNDDIEVEFDSGEWPFTGSPAVITVPGLGSSGIYTVSSSGSGVKDYEARDAWDPVTQASGQVDIEPD